MRAGTPLTIPTELLTAAAEAGPGYRTCPHVALLAWAAVRAGTRNRLVHNAIAVVV